MMIAFTFIRYLCKVAARYFVNNHIKGAAVPIDLVKSTYSVEEESTIISFDVRKV